MWLTLLFGTIIGVLLAGAFVAGAWQQRKMPVLYRNVKKPETVEYSVPAAPLKRSYPQGVRPRGSEHPGGAPTPPPEMVNAHRGRMAMPGVIEEGGSPWNAPIA